MVSNANGSSSIWRVLILQRVSPEWDALGNPPTWVLTELRGLLLSLCHLTASSDCCTLELFASSPSTILESTDRHFYTTIPPDALILEMRQVAGRKGKTFAQDHLVIE